MANLNVEVYDQNCTLISDKNFICYEEGGTFILGVTYVSDTKVTFPDWMNRANIQWVSGSPGEKNATADVEVPSTNSNRIGIITITTKGALERATITQFAYDSDISDPNSSVDIDFDLPVIWEGITYPIVYNNSGNWSVTEYPSFVTLNKQTGSGNINTTLSIPPNRTGASRTGTVVIQTENRTIRYTIEQEGVGLSTDTVSFNSAGGIKTVTVIGGIGYISSSLSRDDITVTLEGPYVRIKCPAIGGITNWSGVLTISSPQNVVVGQINISQKGSSYTVTPTTSIIELEGGEQIITVSSNYSLKSYTNVSVPYGSVELEWVSDKKLKIYYTIPEATGTRTIQPTLYEPYNKHCQPIKLTTITQKDIPFEVDSTGVMFGPSGGTYRINVTGVKDFSVSGVSREDVTITVEGLSIIVNCPARGGSINWEEEISVVSGDEVKRVQIRQTGSDYEFTPKSYEVSGEGGSFDITVTSKYPLTGYNSAVSSVANIDFERVSDTEIKISASYPLAKQGVTDVITLIGGTIFRDIPLTTVTQSKFELVWEFNQDTTLLSTDSTPESPLIDYVFGVVQYESSIDITDMTFTIDYLNGDDWITEITCDTDWQEVHIKAKDNRLGTLRRATITARTEQYDAAREFDVVQEGLALYIRPTSGTIETNGGSVTFGVNDANVGWIGPDEIVISLDGENVPFTYKQHSRTLEVTIQVPANSSDQSRTLYYEVLAYTANPAASATYAVTQSAFEWNMTDSFWISSTGTTPSNQTAILTDQIPYTGIDLGTLDVSFDADWIRSTGQSWNNGSGVIDITVDDNRLGSLRRCTMTIYSPTYNKTKTVTIVQQGFSMSNQNSGYTIDCSGGDVTLFASCNSWIGQNEISIKGQINGALVDLPFTINGGYITENYTNVYVTIPPNAGLAREIEIQMHIRALGNYFIFNVDQPSCDINIDTPEIHFEQKGGSKEVYIESNGDWIIEVVGDWITVTPMNGSGEDVIEISVDPNNTQSDRTGYVYITNGIEREAIVITQGHIIPELYLKERYIKMPLEGGTTYVTLISNIDWTTEWEIQ